MRGHVIEGLRAGGHEGTLILAKRCHFIQRIAEVLRHDELAARRAIPKAMEVGRSYQGPVENIVDVVVAHQVMWHPPKCYANGLLH